MSTTPPRVVVADDSAMMRQIVSSSLTRAGVQVVGSAANGDEALAVCERERPDALMLDLTMPGLDGIGVLRALRQQGRSDMPVIVVSAFSPSPGARAVDALAEGAFDLVAKPAVGESLDDFAAALVAKVEAATRAASARAARQRDAATLAADPPIHARAPAALQHRQSGADRDLDRRPKALAALMPSLPAPLGIGTLIVQHMPPGFTKSLAARLDQRSKLNVREAEGGETARPGVALIAPGGKHLRVRRRRPHQPHRRAGDRRPAPARRPHDRGRRQGLRRAHAAGRDDRHGQRRAASAREEVKKRGGRILVEAAVDLHRLRHATGGQRSEARRRGAAAARACRGDRGGSGGMTTTAVDDYVEFCTFLRKLDRDRPLAVQAPADGAAAALVLRQQGHPVADRAVRSRCATTRATSMSCSTGSRSTSHSSGATLSSGS